MNATSEESDDEEEEDEIIENTESREKERKLEGKEKFSGVLLYSRFQSYCEGQAIIEPSKKLEVVHTSIIVDLEKFSKSFI